MTLISESMQLALLYHIVVALRWLLVQIGIRARVELIGKFSIGALVWLSVSVC